MAITCKELATYFKKPISSILPVLKGIVELSHGDINKPMIIFGRDLVSTDILLSMDESMCYEFVKDMIG